MIVIKWVKEASVLKQRLTVAHFSNPHPIIMAKVKLQQPREDGIIQVLGLAEMMTWVTLLCKQPRPVEVLTEVWGHIEQMM